MRRILIAAGLVLGTAAAAEVLRVGVVLGSHNGSLVQWHPQTTDQEEWAALQAENDIKASFAAAGGRYQLALERCYAGDEEDPAKITDFLHSASSQGIRAVVGPRHSETLVKVIDVAQKLDLILISPSSGLANLAESREGLFRLWPSDTSEAHVLAHVVKSLAHTNAAVALSKDDIGGRSLMQQFAQHFAGKMLMPIQYYQESFNLQRIRDAIANANRSVAFVCNCEPGDIASILDEMARLKWPQATRLIATDRWTPTRSVAADPSRRAFAASLQTTGVLSSIPSKENPAFASLQQRWLAAGHATSIFASALATYDAIWLASRSLLLSARTSANRTESWHQLMSSVNSTALLSWGASGQLALDTKGDLYRAMYDLYAVDKEQGWKVTGMVDAHNLHASAAHHAAFV